MFFNFRAIVLYGLLTVATAIPILNITEDGTPSQLEARMTKKKGVLQDFVARDGKIITKEQIAAALRNLRSHKAAKTKEGGYPEDFSNLMALNGPERPVFADRPTGKGANLLEYPIDIPSEKWPGSARVIATAGATPNFVGVAQHPLGLQRQFRRLKEAKDDCEAESSKPKNAARDLWELVRRKVTGKKAKPAKGKACLLKPKAKPKTPAKTHTKTPTKKPTKKPAKKPAKKHTKKPAKKHAKKPARKHNKRPAKRPTRASRKGGRRGGRKGGRRG
ncbi:uncharacterized protein CC84DRAFT_1212371 [Paraphaeosphaeria sporulosa]|uniref:Uncharacterized protein n=1 Tax=Paraphaeosphaeria sporulosa TaxID=1460663 RepID=A0A177D138_9PLEO|nr:uncharacterized protein CC84DRAFT_1212371 [Paraphaeosphaeria sporulosa]OAG12882.1 hypothetical protein CC84DRAFT_1212371 [Paraphaeosphaeria sporulosa]